MSKDAAIKNLELLASGANLSTFQPGPNGNTLEKIGSWDRREVSSQPEPSETLEKVSAIVSDTLEFMDRFHGKDAALTESEAYTLGRTMNRLRESLPSSTEATPEETNRNTLLLSVFRKCAMAGMQNGVVLDKALLACGDFLGGQNQKLSRDIAPLAQTLVKVGLYTDQRSSALCVLKQLVIQGQSDDIALIAVPRGMKMGTPFEQRLSLQIMTEMVKRGKGYEVAVRLAEQGIYIEDSSVRCASIELMVALLEKGQGVEEALRATALVATWDRSVRWSSHALFKALFAIDQGFDSETLKALATQHPGVSLFNAPESEPDLLDLYTILVKKGVAYEPALAFVNNALRRCADYNWWQTHSHLRYHLVVSCLNLLEALVDQKQIQAYEIAAKTAEHHLKTNTPAHYTGALNVFKALFRNGAAIELGAQISRENAAKNHWFKCYWDTKIFDEALAEAQAVKS